MNQDDKFVISVVAIFVGLILSMLILFYFDDKRQDEAVVELIKQGVKPTKAKCAVRDC